MGWNRDYIFSCKGGLSGTINTLVSSPPLQPRLSWLFLSSLTSRSLTPFHSISVFHSSSHSGQSRLLALLSVSYLCSHFLHRQTSWQGSQHQLSQFSLFWHPFDPHHVSCMLEGHRGVLSLKANRSLLQSLSSLDLFIECRMVAPPLFKKLIFLLCCGALSSSHVPNCSCSESVISFALPLQALRVPSPGPEPCDMVICGLPYSLHSSQNRYFCLTL